MPSLHHAYLYNSTTWRKRAKAQLREHPLCAMCLTRKQLTPATVADHLIPHRGNEWLFMQGDLQSLCFHCHNSRKKDLESLGFHRDVGTDGWPLDPNHPANKPRP
jgi:5-methylcytosine-specific restriction protein A